MLTKLANETAKLTGWLLGGVAAGASFGNILLGVAMILAGPGAVVSFLAR
jgi:hypothetical protein